LNTYYKVIAYSSFNKKHIQKWCNKLNIDVIYPPIEKFHPLSRENIILSVGRFFVTGHNKRQLQMIRVFKQLYGKNKILKEWEYHLIGGLSNNIKSQEYLKKCQEKARGYPIYFHINVSFKNLKELYGKSKIFWHSAGLGEDENKHPERMEHFGITTGEAMSAGCVPIVINRGGQPEIVRNLIDGFLWNNTEELKKYTLKVANDKDLWQKMSQSSIKRSQEFGIDKFRERVKQIINDI
jgi:glycosyltransferase involved in cell wall biosynthesis